MNSYFLCPLEISFKVGYTHNKRNTLKSFDQFIRLVAIVLYLLISKL